MIRYCCTFSETCLLLIALATGCSGGGETDASKQTAPASSVVDVSASADGHFADFGLACSMAIVNQRLETTITNRSAVDVEVFAWDTVWDQYGDALKIRTEASDRDLPFVAPVLRRGKPGPLAYRKINAGSTIEGSYDFHTLYELEQGRELVISLKSPTLSVSIGGKPLRLVHGCNAVTVPKAEQSEEFGSIGQAFHVHPDCTATQKQLINRVIDGALRASDAAKRDHSINAFTKGRWFGSLSSDPQSTYSWISADPSEEVRCGGEPCESGILGAVTSYTFDTRIYLCGALWDNPYINMTSYSQVEVLVHELSHYVGSPEGDIVDWDNPGCLYPPWPGNKCYEYDNARWLADDCPGCARRNAENYAAFAINAFLRPAFMVTAL
jgi:hypothetical protein